VSFTNMRVSVLLVLPIFASTLLSCSHRDKPSPRSENAVNQECGIATVSTNDDELVSPSRMKQVLEAVTGWGRCRVFAVLKSGLTSDCELPPEIGAAIKERLIQSARASQTRGGYLRSEPQLVLRVGEDRFIFLAGLVTWHHEGIYYRWTIDGLFDTEVLLYNTRLGVSEASQQILEEMKCLFLNPGPVDSKWLAVAKCGSSSQEALEAPGKTLIEASVIGQLLDRTCSWDHCEMDVTIETNEGSKNLGTFSLPEATAIRISKRLSKGCVKWHPTAPYESFVVVNSEPEVRLKAGGVTFVCQGFIGAKIDGSVYVWHVRGMFDFVRAMRQADAAERERAIEYFDSLFE
jgi:hypothetical protein